MNDDIKRVFTNAPWEKKVGYCRAIKRGSLIYVSGTVAVDPEGNIVFSNDPYGQTKRCFEIIQESLIKLECSLDKVVRTRMYVTNIDDWKECGKAHQEFFGDFPPATTMIEVSRLINPEVLIEIEVDAQI